MILVFTTTRARAMSYGYIVKNDYLHFGRASRSETEESKINQIFTHRVKAKLPLWTR
jgi:hypothetical protein